MSLIRQKNIHYKNTLKKREVFILHLEIKYSCKSPLERSLL